MALGFRDGSTRRKPVCVRGVGRTVTSLVGVAMLSTLVGVGDTVAAEKSVTEQILDILKNEGKITEEKYQELSAKAREEKGKDSDFNVFWKEGLYFESKDGNFKVQVGGRVQVDWAKVGADDDLNQDLDDLGPELEGDGAEFRRARLFVAGTMYDTVDFKAEYDFAGDGTADFKDVYVGLIKLPYVGNLKVGHMKESYSLEAQTSSNNFTFMERGLPVDTFGPSDGRNTGLKLHNTALEELMTWGVGVFYDTNGFGDSSFDAENWTFAARVTGLPWYEEKGANLLHLGLSYRHEFRDEDTTTRYRQRPATHMTDAFLVDTGVFAADGVNVINPELALVFGPFSVQGEYYWNAVDSNAEDDPNFDGFYISGSYFLTGEHRAYKKADGAFSRLKPNQDFHPDGSGWGAWEIGLRYSTIDLTDGNLEGGEAYDITVGLNWYLNPNTRWMLNYVYSDLDDRANVSDGDLNILETRLQLDF